MFGIFKTKKEKAQDKIIDFLTRADNAVIHSFETGDCRELGNYFSYTCAAEIMMKIARKEVYYEGIAKYRNIQWVNKGSNVYQKDVTYSHVEISPKLFAAVGDDFSEEWFLKAHESKIVVANIRRVV